jgi:hypothetical protein
MGWMPHDRREPGPPGITGMQTRATPRSWAPVRCTSSPTTAGSSTWPRAACSSASPVTTRGSRATSRASSTTSGSRRPREWPMVDGDSTSVESAMASKAASNASSVSGSARRGSASMTDSQLVAASRSRRSSSASSQNRSTRSGSTWVPLGSLTTGQAAAGPPALGLLVGVDVAPHPGHQARAVRRQPGLVVEAQPLGQRQGDEALPERGAPRAARGRGRSPVRAPRATRPAARPTDEPTGSQRQVGCPRTRSATWRCEQLIRGCRDQRSTSRARRRANIGQPLRPVL